MARSIADRLKELGSLASTIEIIAEGLNSNDGQWTPFQMLAQMASIHDFLKRAKVEADWLSNRFGRQMEKKGKRK